MLRVQFIIRSLCRNPGVTILAVVALAVGIRANTALFTVVNSLVLHPYPLPGANRLVAILEREPNDSWPRVAPADYFDLTSQSDSFSALGNAARRDYANAELDRTKGAVRRRRRILHGHKSTWNFVLRFRRDTLTSNG
jgi:hypothetical protein